MSKQPTTNHIACNSALVTQLVLARAKRDGLRMVTLDKALQRLATEGNK